MSAQGMPIAILEDDGRYPGLVNGGRPLPVSSFLIEVAKGKVAGHSLVHKFGFATVGQTIVPITQSLKYKTPSSAIALEFFSDSANDTTGGSGATKIAIQGLDTNWDKVNQIIDTSGAAAVSIPIPMVRLSRWYVSESGSYADETTPSYAGNLTIRVAGAGATWSTITNAPPFTGQSEIGIYPMPKGYTGYLLDKHIYADSAKSIEIYMLQRPNADDVSSPYSGTRRVVEREVGTIGGMPIMYTAPKGPFIGPCDIGFMGKVSVGTAAISVEFTLLLVKDGY